MSRIHLKIAIPSILVSAISLTLMTIGIVGLIFLNNPKKSDLFPKMKYIDYAAMIVVAFTLLLLMIFIIIRYKNERRRDEIERILENDTQNLKKEKIKNLTIGLSIILGSALMMIIGKMGMIYYEYFLHDPSSKKNLIFMISLLLSTIIVVCFMFYSSKKTHSIEDKLNNKIIIDRISKNIISGDKIRRTRVVSKKYLIASFVGIMVIKIIATIAFARILTPEVFEKLPGLNALNKNLCFILFIISIGLTFSLILLNIIHEYNSKLDQLDGGIKETQGFQEKTKQFLSEKSPLIAGIPLIIIATGLVCVGADGAFLSKISEKFKILPTLEHNIPQIGFIVMFTLGIVLALSIIGACVFKHKQIDKKLTNANLTIENNYGLNKINENETETKI